jgi:hypothetical protein
MISIYSANRKPRPGFPSWALFFALGFLYIGLNIWLSGNGFVSDFDVHRWSKAIASIDADEFRIEYIGLLYPHGPIYLLALMHSVLGIDSPHAGATLSAILIALMFSLWSRHLWHKGYPLWTRLTMVALLALHPFSLWAASSGLHNALLLLMFYIFCYGCYLIISIHDLRAVVLVSSMFAVLFFSDERAMLLFLALLPVIPMLAPRHMLGDSLVGIYSILGFPLMIAAGGWMYLNWVFHGDAWVFLQSPEASFRGALSQSENSPWLSALGGQWLAPLGWALLFSALAFPLPLWLALRYRRYHTRLAASLALFLHPMLAVGLATSIFFIEDLTNFLFLLVAATMAVILLMPRMRKTRLMLVLLALGNMGGWATLNWQPSHEAHAWQRAIAGDALPVRNDLIELGLWLKENNLPTLIDDRTLFQAIAARGDAHNLILPFSSQFKNEMKRIQPSAPQVIVANPSRPVAAMDRVTQQFPELFWNGTPGYDLVYDTGEWRVWRRRPQTNP